MRNAQKYPVYSGDEDPDADKPKRSSLYRWRVAMVAGGIYFVASVAMCYRYPSMLPWTIVAGVVLDVVLAWYGGHVVIRWIREWLSK